MARATIATVSTGPDDVVDAVDEVVPVPDVVAVVVVSVVDVVVVESGTSVGIVGRAGGVVESAANAGEARNSTINTTTNEYFIFVFIFPLFCIVPFYCNLILAISG